METIKELQLEREKIKLGCGKKLDGNGDCAYQGANVWRMCPKCNRNLSDIIIRIDTLMDVDNTIKRFINKNIGYGGVQTRNFQKLQLEITG